MNKNPLSSPLRRSNKKSPLRDTGKGRGHALMPKENHISAHDGDVLAAGYEYDITDPKKTKVEDKKKEEEKKKTIDFKLPETYIPPGELTEYDYQTAQSNVMISGCTDKSASNYNPDADIDDGSCIIGIPTTTIDLPRNEKTRKESTQKIIQDIKDTPSETVLGGIFTEKDDYETNYKNIIDFFDKTDQVQVEFLQNVLGKGYTVEQTVNWLGASNELPGIPFANYEAIEITHNETGKTEMINFGIGTVGAGDPFSSLDRATEKGVYINEFNKLSNFINSTAEKKDIKRFKISTDALTSRYADLNSTDGSYIGPERQSVQIVSDDYKLKDGKVISGTSKQVYYGPLVITPKESRLIEKEVNEINLNAQVTTSSVTGYSSGMMYSTGKYETKTTIPYKEEQEKAEQELIKSGNEDPTVEEIQNRTRENLIKDRIASLKTQKEIDFFNSDKVEETGYGALLNIGEIYHRKIDIKQKKELAKTQIKLESKHADLVKEQGTQGSPINAYTEVLEIQNSTFPTVYTFDIKEGEEYVELENGTRLPYSLYQNAQLGRLEYENKLNEIIVLEEDYLGEVETIKDNDARADAAKRNYDDWEKFTGTLYNQTESIMFNIDYGLTNFAATISNRDVTTKDERMMEFRQRQWEWRETMQKDIEFGNAFSSLSNFGRFISLETANQAPIFAMIATGWPGITALGTSSFGEQWGTMAQEDYYSFGPKTSRVDKFFTSLGYGAAEVVFDRFLTYPVLKRSGQAMFGNNYAKLLRMDTKEYFKTYGKRQLLFDPALETASETGTTITQNIITGRPITENLAHAAFSGGFFGTGFGHVPFYKGLVMNTFAKPDDLKTYRSNINTLKELENSEVKLNSTLKANKTKGNNTDNIEGNIETVKQEKKRLETENEAILEKEEKKVNNLEKDFFNSYNNATVEQQKISAKAQRVNADNDLSGNEKQIILNGLLTEFNDLQAKRDYLRDDKNFGKKFAGFKSSTDKKDIDRKDKIYKDAENQLISEGKTDPKEKEIEEVAEIIYNTQEINNEFNKLKDFRKLDDSFQNFQTVEEAIKFINGRKDLSEADKTKVINGLDRGNHGGNLTTTTGEIFSFQVVENMAKDNRLETETHERGHYIFKMAFGNNPEAFNGIAETVLDYVQKTNEKLYKVLQTRVETYEKGDVIPEGKEAYDRTSGKLPTLKNMKSEEVLTNFLELVGDGRIDLKSKKNKGLGGYFAWMINSSTKDALGENADLNFKGEDDAVNFMIKLGKKIKEGTITKQDIKDIKESKIADIVGKENVEKAKETDTKTKIDFSKAAAKTSLEEVQDVATNDDGSFNKEKFDPSDKRIMSELPGMVNAQIINLPINRYLTDNGREELMMETISGLLTKKDIDKFDGRGTLYGFTNGRIKFRILDAFKNNPAIVEDFSQVELDETMKQLEAETVDLTPLDEKLADDAVASDAKINVLALTNKADDIVKVVNPEGDYKQVTDNNIGKVGSIIFNALRKNNKGKYALTDPKTNITTSDAILDVNTGEKISQKELDAGKKGILEPSESKNIQDFFTPIKTTKKFIKILPKENVTKKDADINRLGENIRVSRDTYGRAIGLPNRILEYFYKPKFKTDGKRARSQGLTSQVGLWELKPEFSNLSETELTKAAKQFQEDLGITEDGLTNVLPTKENRSKVGQLLKGAAVVISQQASLSAAQRIKEAQLKKTKEADAIAKVKQEIADVTTGQADISFSEKKKFKESVDVVQELIDGANASIEYQTTEGFVNPTFKIADIIDSAHRNSINKILDLNELEPMHNWDSRSDIDTGIQSIKNTIIAKLPKSLVSWTTLTGKSTYINIKKSIRKKVIDVDGKPMKVLDYYKQELKNMLDNLTDSDYGPEFTGSAAKYKGGKTYKALFGENAEDFNEGAKEGRKYKTFDGEVVIMTTAEINEMHVSMGTQLWQRVKDDIKANRNNARIWGYYFSLVGNVTEHPHRQWAEFIGWSMDPKGYGDKTYEWEHAMQATNSYLYLLHTILGEYDFKTAFELIKQNYKLIALDNYDDKVKLGSKGAKRTVSMGEGWTVMDNWFERYFDEVVAAIENGIDPNGIMTIDDKTLAEVLNINSAGGPKGTKIGTEAIIKNSKAINKARLINKDTEAQGITVLDFDDTLATTKSKVLWTAPDGTTGSLNAEQYASTYQDLAEQGYKFDFSEFNKVVDGKPAPLLNKAKKLAGKFGTDNMFILTARPQESAVAIQVFLKENGLNIPLKNITGLGNSTSEAKAVWMADKVAEGYNDFYFADDALQNVQAVKNMLDQFDIKSKIQQAKIQFSKNLDVTINEILEETTGVDSKKRFSDAQAKLRGKGFKFRGLIPPSAQDFAGLLYNFIGKGKKGERQFETLKKALIDPFARGVNELNTARQNSAEDYRNLLKEFPDVKKDLNQKLDGMQTEMPDGSIKTYEGNKFTVDQAIRVYLWNKAGFEIPGLSARDLKILVDFIQIDPQLVAFADALGVVSKKSDGYSKPGEYWLTENIGSDLMSDGAIGDARTEFLAEWQQNVDQIFSKENLNKIEVIYGVKFREALEDILYRMKTGKNRPTGANRLMNTYMNWVNNSVGAIMFFNIRSAVLQTISATNYINWSDNNPLKAAAAFANFPQFIKDFVFIFNSDMLKQRRSGLRYNVNEAEIAEAVANSDNKAKAIIAWLLKKGFTPTQIADSFAISSGGATFYRNRIKSIMKADSKITLEEAEKQAWLDFQETTEVSQQSARPDLISQQQANPLGRLILSFQNTPMQYGRIMNKAIRDFVNGRGDAKTHISKIVYYGAVQAVVFTALQSALFAVIGSDDDDEKEEMIDKKTERMMNSMIDTWLSVFGYGGKVVSTIKNSITEYNKQRAKDVDEDFMTKSDHAYTLLSVLGFSPPIGSKLRKIYSSIQTEKFNRDIIMERGFTLDNPVWSMIGNVVEGVTNVPLGRLSNKMLNLDNAMDSSNEVWQRAAMLLGWNTWDLGIKDPDIIALGEDIKERKKQEKKMESEKKKFEKKRTKLKEKYPDKTDEEIEVEVKSKELFDLSKQEQVDLLKSLDLSDKEIKKLKKEKNRTDKIAELYKDNSKLIDDALETSKTKPKEEKVKKKEVKLSKSEKHEKSLYKLNKKDQVNMLMSLGYPSSMISKYLKSEKDRVKMIIKLQSKSK